MHHAKVVSLIDINSMTVVKNLTATDGYVAACALGKDILVVADRGSGGRICLADPDVASVCVTLLNVIDPHGLALPEEKDAIYISERSENQVRRVRLLLGSRGRYQQ